jgi:hypothetical protein
MNNEKRYYLRVKTVAPATPASNGNGSYKKTTLEMMVTFEKSTGKWIDSPTAKSVTMNLWTAQKRSDGSMSKGHPFYDVIAEGMELVGEVKTLPTTPYDIETNGIKREARSITVAVFEGEDAIDVANAQLSQRNACVVKIDEEGVQHNTVNLDALRTRNAERAAGNTGTGGGLKFNELTQDEIDELDEQAFIDYNKTLVAAGKPAAKQTA